MATASTWTIHAYIRSSNSLTMIEPMTVQKRKLPPDLKRELVAEAGGKCANPGCAQWRSHIHHIKHWAVYKCHDASDLIAVCPSCHDAIHYGRLPITDETLYMWKGIKRDPAPRDGHIYVEPAPELKLLTGTIALSTSLEQITVFKLSNQNRLSFRALDGDLLQVSSRLQNLRGQEVLRVVENHVRVNRDPHVLADFRAGRARISVPASLDYVPAWLIPQMRVDFPSYGAEGRITAVDLEVLRPGLVRIQGLWTADEGVIVITSGALSFCQPGRPRSISLIGDGEASVLKFTGAVVASMFGFGVVPKQ